MPVLVEMLDVANLEGISEEEGPQAQDFKRALVAINGLRAARQLVDAQPSLETSELEVALENLLKENLKDSFDQQDYAIEVKAQAQALLDHLGSK